MPNGKKMTTGGFFRRLVGNGLDSIQDSSIPQGEMGDLARDVLAGVKEKMAEEPDYVEDKDSVQAEGEEVFDAEIVDEKESE